MAQPGTPVAHSLSVALAPDIAFEQVTAGMVGCPDYTPSYSGTGSLMLTRKYIPQWAIVLAIVGSLLFLLGLLFLLYRDTETVTVRVEPDGAGSKITITGLATDDMARRIESSIASM